MQFKTITALTLGLFAAGSIAQSTECGVRYSQCNNPGVTACECNAGGLLVCGTNPGTNGYVWVLQRDCPPATFSCVNGACTSKRALRFER